MYESTCRIQFSNLECKTNQFCSNFFWFINCDRSLNVSKSISFVAIGIGQSHYIFEKKKKLKCIYSRMDLIFVRRYLSNEQISAFEKNKNKYKMYNYIER